MDQLTAVQQDILKFIREKLAESGLAPTFREIQEHFGYKAVGTVQDHLKALRKKGALKEMPTKKNRNQARGILPSDFRPDQSKQLSIFGEIAAGPTKESEQIELGKLTIASYLAKDPCYALRVVGNSMIDAGILEGDILIVEKEARIKNGDIVVALVEGETTVKRYQQKSGEPWLLPENAKMKPIPLSGREFKIQGKVVGLQRKIT